MPQGRVLVAMSGGVDSAVAAVLLVEQGYECVGATMQLWSEDLPGSRSASACCSIAAAEDARRVATALGMPHYVFGLEQEFRSLVVDRFADAYLEGMTPNPCILCNHEIKFGSLMNKALDLECEYVATGHYARVWFAEGRRRWCLARGLDSQKDQSYALYGLNQAQLSRTLLPLGQLTKRQTREIAARHGLVVASKPESQEICFVPDDDYRRFIRDYRPHGSQPGPILDRQGQVLGTHEGLAFYTIGQRKGLGLSRAKPVYVVDLDPVRNAVVVGDDADVLGRRLVAGDVNWVAVPGLDGPTEVEARIRYRVPPSSAVIKPLDDELIQTEFAEPQRAITPGQSVVWYQGELVLGGGIIQRA